MMQNSIMGKLDNLETLMRNANCQGSITREIELINISWDALMGITKAEKISPQVVEAQRNYFKGVCNSGQDCVKATKSLLEIIANYDGKDHTTVFGQCSLISILNKGDKANYYF